MKGIAVALTMLIASPVAVVAVITGPESPVSTPSSVARSEIPADLLPVYMAAAQTCPGLPWQVLAAIGWNESRHADGRADPTTGQVSPPIIGLALDGSGGLEAIPDHSEPDGWAHALGPMQFLSTTWAQWATLAPDRPPGATPDVNNAWDSIFSAANYLCGSNGRVDDVRAVVRRYNHSDRYVDEVLTKATAYGSGDWSPMTNALVTGSPDAVIAAAMTQSGVPYVWGDETPGVGFDCSGLVQWAFAQAGIRVPRTTQQQVLVGVPVAISDVQPGDLVFSRGFEGGVAVDLGHVAIAVGGGMEIVAPHTGAVVRFQPIATDAVQAVRRILR